MSDEKRYKLVNGELVELSEEDLAQIEKDAAEPPLPQPEPVHEPKEPPDAKRRSK